MIGLPAIYAFVGLLFAGYALLGALDRSNPRRFVNGLFWGLLALSFLGGDRLGDTGNGLLVLALVAAGTIGIGRGHPPTTTPDERRVLAGRLRDRLFVPALAVPTVTLAGTFLFRHAPALIDPKQATLVALAAGMLIGLTLAFALFRTGAPLAAPLQEGRRLADSIGWAIVLPQMLAALGVLFAQAGVGAEVGRITEGLLPSGSLLAAVIAYGGGMALLTILMGNAFAAFPVMFAAIGLPLLVHGASGSAAGVAALGMLMGFCGTLVTPMAANFNLVPAALLDLPSRWGVIRVAAPTAAAMLIVNLAILWGFAFR